MKELILNADDFGLTRGVNAGIIRAHREGILTSATLMANGPAFEGAVEGALANSNLGVGCHLVLVGGFSVASPEEIPTLAGRDGRLPASLATLVAKVTTGRIRAMDMERELLAQIEKIRRAGIDPTHLDTHKHAHAHPGVLEAVGRVARQTGITQLRKPMENLRDSWRSVRDNGGSVSRQLAAAAAVRAFAPRFRAMARKYGLITPDHFLGLAATGHLGPAALCRLIDTLAEGRTEIMLHPGICDEDLAKTGSRLQAQRQLELEGLLAPEAKGAVARHGVRLISYRELGKPGLQ
jgi:chitin disaccharide deacetylase